MRHQDARAKLGAGLFLLAVLANAPGCGSAANAGLGPMLQDAPPTPAGHVTTASYAKSRLKDKKSAGATRNAPAARPARRNPALAAR